MFRLPVHRRFAAWLALAAWLLAALWPLAAQALRANGAEWVQVCSVQGMRWVSTQAGAVATGADDLQTPQAGMAWEHCPLCHTSGHGAALPPAAPQALPLLPLQHAVPRLFLAARSGLHAWQAAQARAPPAWA